MSLRPGAFPAGTMALLASFHRGASLSALAQSVAALAPGHAQVKHTAVPGSHAQGVLAN